MDLTAAQVRALGCLIEKEATTPEHYPLSSNALVQACNQKNNRDPLTSYTEREIDAVMLELRQLGLARTVHASNARVDKHRHVLDEAWHLSREHLAVLAVSVLRGQNTINELLTRTERYVSFPDASAVRAVVDDLQRRDPPLLVEIGRQPGQRETRFGHLLTDDETPAIAPPGDGHAGDGGPRDDRSAPVPSAPPTPTAAALTSSAAAGVDTDIDALRAELAELRERFDELCRRLGEPL